jgi:hypothetical protein
MSYREQFATKTAAQSYEDREYASDSYGQILWQIEQQQLRTLITDLRSTHATIDALDFATGSGRILSFIESLANTSVGIEISEPMAALARSRVAASTILCKDITAADASIEGRYDLITAYRFLLNAEPALRQSALLALRDRLRDASSILIFNNHGNLWSHKAILYPVHSLGRGHQPATSGNYLTHRQIKLLMKRVGLRAERMYGCGVLGARLVRTGSPQHLLAWEQRLANSVLWRAGVNQTYVAQLA